MRIMPVIRLPEDLEQDSWCIVTRLWSIGCQRNRLPSKLRLLGVSFVLWRWQPSMYEDFATSWEWWVLLAWTRLLSMLTTSLYLRILRCPCRCWRRSPTLLPIILSVKGVRRTNGGQRMWIRMRIRPTFLPSLCLQGRNVRSFVDCCCIIFDDVVDWSALSHYCVLAQALRFLLLSGVCRFCVAMKPPTEWLSGLSGLCACLYRRWLGYCFS